MKLIVGLGNPGTEYEKTRHNVGFMVLDALAESETWQESSKARALYLKKRINNSEAELLKPTTYMNESGMAVAYAMKKHELSPDDLIVVHDDKDLLLGEIRVHKNRGSAGHNGVESIFNHLKTKKFWRVRVGTATENKRKMDDTTKFVLSKFGIVEKTKLKDAIELAVSKVRELL